MYSTDPEIQRQSENVRAALLVYFERNPDMKSPYDGMCYVASATLKKLVGNQVRLWKTRDQNNQFHWWCETRNGETIDLTSEQYSENNIEVPSNGRAAKMKESGRILSFTSYKKKVDSLLEIIQNFQLTDLPFGLKKYAEKIFNLNEKRIPFLTGSDAPSFID